MHPPEDHAMPQHTLPLTRNSFGQLMFTDGDGKAHLVTPVRAFPIAAPAENIYPMPMLTTDDASIHVGRVRALGERVQLVAATDNAFRVAESAIDIAFELADRD